MEREVFEREDFLTEEESRYLRRQKPIEVRRRKLSRAARRRYGLYLVLGMGIAAAGPLAYAAYRYFMDSPRYRLATLDQIELVGNRHVSRRQVLEKFAADAGQSILRIPLEQRRLGIEEIAWVESAIIERTLPNRLRVILKERQPVAFFRTGSELSLMDGSGVVLERPERGEFHFPVLTGIPPHLSAEERARRVGLFRRFLEETELVVAGAGAQVSEVDLSDDSDVRVTLTDGDGAVVVHCGNEGFMEKMRIYAEHIGEWRSARGGSGKIVSVDLRFERQVIVHGPQKGQEGGKGR